MAHSIKNIRHVFFDLDHTLWDFEKNSSAAIAEIFDDFQLHQYVNSFEKFINQYQQINAQYWQRYNKGEIDKRMVRYGRFYDLFQLYKIDDHIKKAEMFADAYLAIAPAKTHLFPHTHEILAYLGEKYKLHLISNGFKEVLEIKITRTDLKKYFDVILSSEDVGVNKPDIRVFHHALNLSQAEKHESVMIGDSYDADILGAHNAGMQVIHFNPKGEVFDHNFVQIHSLHDLRRWL